VNDTYDHPHSIEVLIVLSKYKIVDKNWDQDTCIYCEVDLSVPYYGICVTSR
jgi:hypothetical protein